MTKFVVTTDYRYWWPIKVRLPNPDPRRAGQVVEQSFKAEFRALPTDEANELRKEIDALEGDERHARQHDLIRRVVVGWDSDVVGEDNEPIQFAEDVMAQLLTNVWVVAAFYRAWSESMTGEKARQGN